MNRYIFLLLVAASAVLAQPRAGTPIWTRFETELEAAKDYENPLLDVEVRVEFSSPSGRTTVVPAFWDYDRSWKARIMPSEVGLWRYRWTSSDTSDPKLHGTEGEFECVFYSGNNPLYLHGIVDVAPEGRFFAHADGKPFFWLGDTAWNGALLAGAKDWEKYLADRAAKRFSVVQFVMMPWRSAGGDADGRLAYIVRRGRIEVDPIFFQRMDERVDAINEHGMLAAQIVFWAHSSHPDLNPGTALSEEQLIVLGRYIVARYGAHHVAWLLGGDGRYEGDFAERWKRVGHALFGDGAPGVRHPASIHAVGSFWTGKVFGGDDWFDFIGYQSGHRRISGLEWITRGEPSSEWREDARRPVLNLEPCYEAHRNRTPGASDVFTDEDVRHAAWNSLLASPPAGLTYGAHGIWGWHPRAVEPMTHPGTGVGPAWFDAMNLPGSLQLKYMAEFFEEFDWQRLRPAQDLLRVQPGQSDVMRWIAVARTEDGGTLVAYSSAGDPIELDAAAVSGMTSGFWLSPRSGERLPAKPSERLDPPRQTDWVLRLSMSAP